MYINDRPIATHQSYDYIQTTFYWHNYSSNILLPVP